jgi:hypothetical protein
MAVNLPDSPGWRFLSYQVACFRMPARCSPANEKCPLGDIRARKTFP